MQVVNGSLKSNVGYFTVNAPPASPSGYLGGKSEVLCILATADISDTRIVKIIAEAEIKFGVKCVTKKQLHRQLAGFKLGGKAAQTFLVSIGRRAKGKLVAKFLGEFAFEPDGSLIVHRLVFADETQALA